MRQRPLFRTLFIAVLAAIGAATIIAVTAAMANERNENRRAESVLAVDVTNNLARTVGGSTARLDSVRGLFESVGDVTAAEFSAFTQPLVSEDDALIFLAWNPRVTAAQRADFEAITGRPIMLPGTNQPAPQGRTHFPIRYISSGSFARHLGADPGSEAKRAATLRSAADLSAARISAPVTLRDGSAGLIMATPVYGRGADGVAQLRGYTSGAYRVKALADSALAGLADDVSIRVTDGTTTLFSTGGDLGPGATTTTIDAAGREWVVAVNQAGSPSIALPLAIGLGGLLLAALVATTVLGAQRRQNTAEAGRATAEGQLATLLAQHKSILAAAGEGIIGVDREGRATFVNPAAAELLQRSPEAVLGGRVASFFRRETPGGPTARVGEANDPIATAIESGSLQRDDGLVVDHGGQDVVPVEHTAAPLVEGDETVGAVVSFRDITVRRQLEEQTKRSLEEAERRAAVDPLTGLANHRTFHERLSAEVERAKRHSRSLSLVVMDLDHFKLVNDTHGHQEGDRVLAAVSQVMAPLTRAGELLARVGGEEFALILPEADEMDAYQAAERIRNVVAGSDFPPYGRITLSAGVCGLAQAGDAGRLYQLADGALYWAKNRGRDAVFRYSPEVVQALSAEERANRLQREQALMSIRILARAVDAKDPTTRRHSERVADLSAEIATRLGWPEDRLELLREAGLVHDVGKIGVPDAILFKPGRLDAAEYEAVKQHAALSAQIVAEALSPEQISWVRGHHERWDGAGYPDNLSGFDIPEGARIMALADAWDTMLSERPYKAPFSADEAIAECERFAGSQFWPAGVEVLGVTVGVVACD